MPRKNCMKYNLKKTNVFLIVSISFFVLVFPAYLLYNGVIETDFPSDKPTFENLDQDYLLANEQNRSYAIGPSTSFFILETYLFRQLPRLSFGISSLDQKLSVLRC
jgi:hypothetical protein